MKQTICTTCQWKKESDDEFFGKRIRCNRFSKNLEGTVITQCKFFIEETDGNYLGGAI